MNIPNFLTMIRFFMIPAFILVFFSSIENNILIATYIFILAGITDVLDGYIARKYNLITKAGTVLDPLADKLMQITVLLSFTIAGFLPVWVIVVVGLKELMMIIGGLILYFFEHETVIPANKYGKIATLSFYVAILSVAFKVPTMLSYFLIILAVALTIFAFINYLNDFRHIKSGYYGKDLKRDIDK